VSDEPTGDGAHGPLGTVLRGAGISGAAQLVAAGLAFAQVVALGRLFGRDGLGLYSVGFPLSRYLMVAGMLGLDAAIVRTIPALRAKQDRAGVAGVLGWSLRVALVSGLIAAALLSLAAVPLANRAFERAELVAIIRLFALTVPLWVLLTVLVSAAQAFDRQELRAIPQQIVLPSVQLGLVVLFGVLGLSVASAVVARLVGLGVAVIIAVLLVRGLVPPRRDAGISAVRRRELAAFGLPAAGATLVISTSSSLGLLLTGILAGAGETGLFAAALRVSFIGVLLVRSVTWALDPVVARLQREDSAELGRLTAVMALLIVAAGVPLAAALIALAEPLSGLFGRDFAPAVPAIRVMAADILPASMFYLLNHVVMFAGRSRLALVNNALLVGLILGLDLLLVPTHGALGAALAQFAAGTLMTLVLFAEARTALRLHVGAGWILGLLALGAFSAAVLTGRTGAGIAGLVAVMALGWGLVWWSLPSAERDAVRRLIRRVTGGG